MIRPPKDLPAPLREKWTPEQTCIKDASNFWYMFPALLCAWPTSSEPYHAPSSADMHLLLDNVGYKIVPNLTESPMPEEIKMTFHPLPTTVKPKRLSEFKPLDKVTSHGGIVTVIRDPLGKRALLDSTGNTFVDAGLECWFLESDWINGKPRELVQEPVRNSVCYLCRNDVLADDNWPGVRYRKIGTAGVTTVVERLDGSGYNLLQRDTVVTLLGHVTFGANP